MADGINNQAGAPLQPNAQNQALQNQQNDENVMDKIGGALAGAVVTQLMQGQSLQKLLIEDEIAKLQSPDA